MNYDIKLYTHGVPKGQSTWGVSEYDSNYIDSFYGRKSDTSVQMLVEIKQFGANTNCYYTYFRVNNISDNSGRAGSYFALTLRLNYYYADIQNIYNLLDAAYNKFIVGSILVTTNGVSKYLISDFTQSNTILMTLEQEIRKYLMQFSTDTDFLSLSEFKANGQNEAGNINLLECDVKAVANHVKIYSNVSVSPQYPSTREQRVIQKMNNEIATTNADAKQQITTVQQKAQADIQNIQSQANQSIKAAQREKEEEIQAIKNEYKDADKTISALRQEISKALGEIKRLQTELSTLQSKLNTALQYKVQYENAKVQLDKTNKVIDGVRNSLFGLNGLAELPGVAGTSSSHSAHREAENDDDFSNREGNNSSFMKVIKKIHLLMDFFVMLVLVGIIGVTIPKSCTTDNSTNAELSDANEKIGSLNNELDSLNNELEEAKKKLLNVQTMFTIDVESYSPAQPMDKKKTYAVNLQNVKNPNGKWVSNDFVIDGNKIKPKYTGMCKISYELDGVVIASREINVN